MSMLSTITGIQLVHDEKGEIISGHFGKDGLLFLCWAEGRRQLTSSLARGVGCFAFFVKRKNRLSSVVLHTTVTVSPNRLTVGLTPYRLKIIRHRRWGGVVFTVVILLMVFSSIIVVIKKYQKPPPPVAAEGVDQDIEQCIAQGEAELISGDQLQARMSYYQAMLMAPTHPRVVAFKKRLEEVGAL